jgi:hypothetical protein
MVYVSAYVTDMGRDSLADIATCYRLDGLGIESSWGARYSVPVQADHGAVSLPYSWSRVSFLGMKVPERCVDHPSLSSVEIKESVEL